MGYPRAQVDLEYHKSKKQQEGESFLEKKRKQIERYFVKQILKQKGIKKEESQHEIERVRERKVPKDFAENKIIRSKREN